MEKFADVDCSLLEDHLLLVKFPDGFDLNFGNPIVQVIGIPNRLTNENFHFACTLNNLAINPDGTNGRRMQIINGTGKFNKKLIELEASKIGALDLFEISIVHALDILTNVISVDLF